MKKIIFLSIYALFLFQFSIQAQQYKTKAPIFSKKGGGEITAYFQEQFTNPLNFGTLTIPTFQFNSLTIQSDFINCGDFDETGTLYGVTANSVELITIDTNNGAINPVGSLTGVMAGQNNVGLSYDFTTSTMYFITDDVNSGADNAVLYTVDLSTGTVTTIATGLGMQQPVWLEIDNNGIAYAGDAYTDSLYTINLTTGQATEIGSLGSFDLNNIRHGASIDHSTNTLYMLSTIVDGIGLVRSFYFTINLLTGAATNLNGPFNSNEFGLFAIPGNPALSIEDASNVAFNVYPNPTNGEININLGKTFSELTITTTNIMGQIMSTKTYTNINSIKYTIDAPSGVYFMNITTNTGIKKTLKIMRN
jgi:Secretion system C-terminal sorting domain/Repeat of unknown function (DUF6923)